MKAGDVVRCKSSRGYDLTEGKHYVVVAFTPESRIPGEWFTWPEYVAVVDDGGKVTEGHAYRFELVP